MKIGQYEEEVSRWGETRVSVARKVRNETQNRKSNLIEIFLAHWPFDGRRTAFPMGFDTLLL